MGLWLVGVLLMQVAWILTIPPFRGSDEFDHVYRAAAVADGEWYVDEWATDGRGLLVSVPPDIVEAAHFQCEQLPYTGPENCEPSARPDGDLRAATGAGLYHPAFYWVVGTVAQPLEGVPALYAMRLATATLCLICFGIAAWAVARMPSRWPLAALTLALSPVMAYSTAVVAPNGLEMAAAMALWATLLAAVQDPRAKGVGRLLAAAIALGALLCTLRLLGPMFVVLIVSTVAIYAPGGARRLVRERRRTVTAGLAVIVAATTAAAAWVLANGQTNGPPVPDGAGVSMNVQQILVWNFQTIAAFPYRNQPGAPIVYPIVLGLVTALVILGFRAGARSARAALVLAIIVTLVLPIALTLATMSGRGVIWQGRYTLPYSLGVVLVAGFAVDRGRRGVVSWRVAAPSAVLITVGVAACLIKVRSDELASGTEAAWVTPHPALLILVTSLACTAMARAVSVKARADG